MFQLPHAQPDFAQEREVVPVLRVNCDLRLGAKHPHADDAVESGGTLIMIKDERVGWLLGLPTSRQSSGNE